MNVTITHSDGSTDTIPQTLGWTRRREIGNMRKVTITVDRADAQAANLAPKQDTVALGSVDTVRLVDVEKGGPTWRLIGYSFEWDANAVEPTPGGDLREGDDSELVNELVGEVPSWTAGTVESHTGSLEFVLNHAHRHEALRRVERNVPGELRFRDEGTVDYVENLGSDKTGSVTLSSAAGTIEDEIRITNRGRELDGTHIRVLGAHEGEAQIFANLVPSDDPASYENRVDYQTDRWEPGDSRDWDRWENKDVSDQATIEEEAGALGAEIGDQLIEAEATVSGVDVDVGDWVRVAKPDADLDRNMRIHRIKTVAEGATSVDEVLLSTRTVVRQDDSGDLKDITRYNTAFEGSSVILQGGGGRQPVNGTVNAFESFRYPNVAHEHTVEIEVRGLPYRAYSSGAAATDTGEFFNPNQRQFAPGKVFTTSLSNSYFVSSTVFAPTSGSFKGALITYDFLNETGSESTVDMQIQNQGQDGSGNDILHEATGIDVGDDSSVVYNYAATEDEISVGDTITFYIYSGDIGTESDNEDLGQMNLYVRTYSEHEHDADPGLTAFPDETPTSCDLVINGSTVASDIGSGEFTTVVDATDVMNQGQWNDIEVTSDSLGHVSIRPYVEAYKKIGGGG